MKKLLLAMAAFCAVTFGIAAQETGTESEKFRVDILASDCISTNLMSTVNTTTLGVRFGLCENKLGLIAGAKVREGFCTADINYGFPLDFYWLANPFLGIEWNNVEACGGVTIIINDDTSPSYTPYVSLCYNLDLIKQEPGFGDRLCLKLGAEYFMDNFKGNYGARKNEENAGVGAAVVDVFSLIIPKVSVGVQYSIGWGF